MTTKSVDFGGDPKLPWYWEGNVQAQVARFLVAEGWTLERVADTASRQRGIDLVATKGERRLAIEVKGFPGTVYARGPKVGQPKPTPPNLQARIWLAEALLSAVLMGSLNARTEVALAFPDVIRYRELLGKIGYAIDRLGLRVFLAQERGGVTELQEGTCPQK